MTKLKINLNTVEIVSDIDGKTITNIWIEEFDKFRKAFNKCEEYKKKQEELDKSFST